MRASRSGMRLWSLSLAVRRDENMTDAIVVAANNMKKAHYRRKALLIISDGGDNRSRYAEKDVRQLIRESYILVYSIGVFDREFRTLEEHLGPELLSSISGLSGAGAYVLDNPNDLPGITRHIALELRNQYILGYSPQEPKRDGKWRKIKIRLSLPRGFPELRVQARPDTTVQASNCSTTAGKRTPDFRFWADLHCGNLGHREAQILFAEP